MFSLKVNKTAANYSYVRTLSGIGSEDEIIACLKAASFVSGTGYGFFYLHMARAGELQYVKECLELSESNEMLELGNHRRRITKLLRVATKALSDKGTLKRSVKRFCRAMIEYELSILADRFRNSLTMSVIRYEQSYSIVVNTLKVTVEVEMYRRNFLSYLLSYTKMVGETEAEKAYIAAITTRKEAILPPDCNNETLKLIQVAIDSAALYPTVQATKACLQYTIDEMFARLDPLFSAL